MIPYILHVALLLSICLLFYKLLLQKETFYRLNRMVLVFCLALSFALPLIPVPQQFALREASQPVAQIAPVLTDEPSQMPQTDIIKKLVIAKAVASAKVQTSQRSGIKSAPQEVSAPTVPLLHRIITWAFYLYWIGVIAFGLNLIVQLIVLLYQAYTKPAIIDGKFRIVELTGDKAPCSFGNSIFINPEKYDWDTYSQILLHEKIHIQQGHSIDILLAELVLVMQWFNPFAWIYRAEVENNLEFLTDDSVLGHKDVERSSYQMSLLKVSAPHLALGITTNYNQSLLKRRIVMMNAKKSNIHIMWKYFFLVPLLGILACALNNPVANATTTIAKTTPAAHKVWVNNTDTSGSWFATIKGDKVKMEFRSDDDDHNWSSSSDFNLSEFPSLPKDKKENFTLTRDAGTILFNGKFDGSQGYGHYKFTANKAFRNFLSQQGISGAGEGDDFAFFMIGVDKQYVKMLADNGYKNISKNDLISMGALKVNSAYIKFWKENGYEHLSPENLVSAKAVGITGEYLSDIRKAGYDHLSVDKLISLKATGVTGQFISKLHADEKGNKAEKSEKADKADQPGKADKVDVDNISVDDIISVKAMNIESVYIKEIKMEGYPNISINELTSMKAVGVTPKYIESFKNAGYSNISANDMISLKSVGVTPEYVKNLSDMGYKNIPAHELVSLKSVGVTPEYLRSFEASGFKNISARDLTSLKSVGVTPEYAKGFAAQGYANIPMHQLISMKSVGVTPEFVAAFSAAGYKNISANQLVSMKSVGVTPAFVKHFESLGYKNIPANQLVSMKSVGVDEEFISSFKNAGYTNIPVNDLVSLKSMGITPDFAKGFASVGYKDIPYRDLTGLKALDITPEYIKSFQDIGYKDVPIRNFSSLKSVGVTPDFIAGFKKIGYDNISINQATSLKATGVTPGYVNDMREKGFKSDDLNKYIQLKNAFNDNNK